jgi:prepilin-type processing-associated H-X9-DG protein
MHKSRVVLACLALVLILALLIPLVGCGGGGPAVPCKVSSVSGDVQVLRNGSTESVKATNGIELAVGDTITTGNNGSANLTFFDGSVMEIKANSKIVVNELSTASTGSTTVSLNEQVGNTINRIGKLVDSASKYEVETPAAVAVVRGTVFDLLVQQTGFTTVKSEEGSVSFTAAGQTVTVNKGFQSSAAVGGTPSTPSAITTVTPTKTPTATATSTSGQTLGDVLGTGRSIGDVKYDQVMTTSGQTQSTTMKIYMKDAWLSDKMKFRYEISEGGQTMIYLIDLATRTYYWYLPQENIAYKMDMGQAPENPVENAEQIIPVKVGTETVDGKLCDVYQWTFEGSSTKQWVWKEKSFPVKMEATTSSGTTVIEYKNIVFGPLADSLFQLPAGVQIQSFPSYSPGS